MDGKESERSVVHKNHTFHGWKGGDKSLIFRETNIDKQ